MHQTSYINLLKDEFLSRKAKNSRYSLRSFAKFIDITPSHVSMIFSGKRHLSHEMALKVSKKLKWSKEKRKYFVSLLEFENPKSDENKEIAFSSIQKLESDHLNFNPMDIDTFEVISAWYYSAILILLPLLKVKASLNIISKRLKLNSMEVENAMKRLERLGLVKSKANYWIGIYDYLKVGHTPSEAIRIYHRQHLSKAAEAIKNQLPAERDFTNMTLTVDVDQIPLAKKKIVEFHNEMTKLLEGKNPTEVYQLSVQLFRLTEPQGK